MTDVEITPGVGVGPIRIGQTRSEVHRSAGPPDSQFRKTNQSPTLSDVYASLGIHVYYTKLETVEYLETFAVEGVRHIVSGLGGFTVEADRLISALSSQGHAYSQDEGFAFTFPEIGVTLWRSDAEARCFETIGVARAEYFGEGAA